MVRAAMTIKLTTKGRRSGSERTVTVYAWEDGETDLLLVASWGGRPRDPGWAHNLRANPEAIVRRGRATQAVVARELHGAERERAWDVAVERFPLYATYQRKTSRLIPVFRLEAR